MEYTLEELLPIVQRITEKYTLNDNTSITYELANQLMEAILYCIDEYLSESESENFLRTSKPDAQTAYETGHRLVYEKTVATKNLYADILNSFNSYGNHTYHDTVVTGMPAFFMHYDTKFAPQNHILTLDYPTIAPITGLCGVDAIWQYLTYIQLEQIFLHRFPTEHITGVLASHQPDYQISIINVCSHILQHSLLCMLIKKPLNTQTFTSSDFDKAAKVIGAVAPEELQTRLFNLLALFIQNVYENNNALLSYLKRDISDFSVRLVQFASQYPNCTCFHF